MTSIPRNTNWGTAAASIEQLVDTAIGAAVIEANTYTDEQVQVLTGLDPEVVSDFAQVLDDFIDTMDATDSAVSNLINDKDKSTAAALAKVAPVSVAAYGAVGDGSTDDTPAIQAAIASGKPVTLIPGAVHKITGSITPDVLEGNGATLRVAADVNGLVVTPHAKIHNLNIETDYNGYSAFGIYLDGESGFNVASTAELNNIVVKGPGTTSGAAIGCDDGGTTRMVVTYVTARAIRCLNWQYGLRMVATKSSAPSSWMTANTLDISTYNCQTMYHLEGEVDGNTISGQGQATSATQYGLRILGGNSNDTTKLYMWDFDSYPSAVTYDFTGGSYNKFLGPTQSRVGNSIPRGDNGSNERNNQAINGLILPKPKDRSQFSTRSNSNIYTLQNFLGQQDDILKMAHKNYTVSSTVTPDTGSVNSCFTFGSSAPVWNMTPGNPVTVTVEAASNAFSSVHLIGILFQYFSIPEYVKIETETLAGVKTTQLETAYNKGPLLHTMMTGKVIAGSFAKIHWTFGVDAIRTIRVASLFAASGNIHQKSFIQTDGNTPMWGSLRFGETGIGPILVSPGGQAYRITVDNAGNLGTTAVS